VALIDEFLGLPRGSPFRRLCAFVDAVRALFPDMGRCKAPAAGTPRYPKGTPATSLTTAKGRAAAVASTHGRWAWEISSLQSSVAIHRLPRAAPPVASWSIPERPRSVERPAAQDSAETIAGALQEEADGYVSDGISNYDWDYD
jgi:hypothetical protein